MLNLFIVMSLGSNVVIANSIGRNDQNMVKRAVHTSVSYTHLDVYKRQAVGHVACGTIANGWVLT